MCRKSNLTTRVEVTCPLRESPLLGVESFSASGAPRKRADDTKHRNGLIGCFVVEGKIKATRCGVAGGVDGRNLSRAIERTSPRKHKVYLHVARRDLINPLRLQKFFRLFGGSEMQVDLAPSAALEGLGPLRTASIDWTIRADLNRAPNYMLAIERGGGGGRCLAKSRDSKTARTDRR